MSPSITVAICSLNGARRLPETLSRLREQIGLETALIVVDDGSTDSTSEIANFFGAKVVRHEKNLGFGAARESALLHCKTDVLAFIDDECIVGENWFTSLQGEWAARLPGLAALAGPIYLRGNTISSRYLARNNPFLPIRYENAGGRTLKNRLAQYILSKQDFSSGYIESAGNGNLSLNVRFARALGGYDISLVAGGEDSDICQRITARFGEKAIYFSNEVQLTHYSHDRLSNVFHRSFRYGKSSGRKWRIESGIPTFLPLPTLLLIGAIAFSASEVPWRIFLPVLLAPLFVTLLSRPVSTWRLGHFFIDPWVRLGVETASNVGFLFGYVEQGKRVEIGLIYAGSDNQ